MDNKKSLVEEVSSVIDKLQGIFDELGLDHFDRQAREASVYTALNATLQTQLRDAAQERNKLAEECKRAIEQINQMEKSLGDKRTEERQLKVSVPLCQCLASLKDIQKSVQKRHTERYDAVKRLVHSLNSYASRLESNIVQIPLPPITDDSSTLGSFDLSHSYYDRLEQEFNRIHNIYTTRLAKVQNLANGIVNLYAELGVPQEHIDRSLLYGQTDPESLGLTKDDLERLQAKKQKLDADWEERKTRVESLKADIKELWVKLGMEDQETKVFLAQHRGYNPSCVRELEEEYDRLIEMKKANLHIFVEDCRRVLEELWEQLYFSEDEIAEFHPAQSDVYTDALLQVHENEIARLQALVHERAPLLNMISKHKELLSDKEQLAISSQDSSRLTGKGPGGRDPTRLLREERMRKRIAKELPKVEVELKKALEKWEEEHGEPLYVKAENYFETLMRVSPVAQSRSKASTTASTASSNTIRGRSNTTSATASSVHQRSRSRPAPVEKAAPPRSKTPGPPVRPKTPAGGQLYSAQSSVSREPPRSKTPGPRPKTPAGGQLYNPYSSTIGRTAGRNVPSAASNYAASTTSTTSSWTTATSSTTSTHERPRPKTPGLGGRIPQATGTVSPSKLPRAPLQPYSGGYNSPNTGTIGRNQAIKRKADPGVLMETAPKMKQLTTPTEACPRMFAHEQDYYEQPHPQMRQLQQQGSIRSIRSIRSVSPDENLEAYEDNNATPRANRQVSTSSYTTVDSMDTGSENWETYETDTEPDSERRSEQYASKPSTYRPAAGFTGFGGGQALGMLRQSTDSDEWMSEADFARN